MTHLHHAWLLAVAAVGILAIYHYESPKKVAGAPGQTKPKAPLKQRIHWHLLFAALVLGAVGWVTHYRWQGILLGILAVALAVAIRYRERKRAKRQGELAPVDAVAAGILPGSERIADCWHKKGYLIYAYPPTHPDPDGDLCQKLAFNMGGRLQHPVTVVPAPTCRFYVRKAEVAEVAPEPPPPPIPHPPNLLPGEMLIPLGVDAAGEVVTWPLSRGLSHALVGGQTGKGKSSTMRTIITEVCARGVQVYICDVKRIGVAPMWGWPGVVEVATSTHDIEKMMTAMCEEMDRRYEDVEAGRVRRRDLPITMLVLDELADLFDQAVEEHKALRRQGDPPILVKFRRLVRLGSECRIHLLVGTQRPDARIVGGDSRAQFTARIGVCVEDPDLMKMLRIRKHVTHPLQGRAIVNAGSGDIECQTYWTPETLPGDIEDDDRAILDGLLPGWAQAYEKPEGVQGWNGSNTGGSKAEGAEKDSSKARLRVVREDGTAGQDSGNGGNVGAATKWRCPVNECSCAHAYQRLKCKCPTCLEWKRQSRGSAKTSATRA